MGNMRKYKRALTRAKANKMSHYGRNGKSVKLFRMIWDGELEAAGKGALAKKQAAAKAKQEKNDNALTKALKKAKAAIAAKAGKKNPVTAATEQ